MPRWVCDACGEIHYENPRLVVGTVLSTDKVFADETTLPVLEPGRGKTKTGRFWLRRITISKRMRAKLREIKIDPEAISPATTR